MPKRAPGFSTQPCGVCTMDACEGPDSPPGLMMNTFSKARVTQAGRGRGQGARHISKGSGFTQISDVSE